VLSEDGPHAADDAGALVVEVRVEEQVDAAGERAEEVDLQSQRIEVFCKGFRH